MSHRLRDSLRGTETFFLKRIRLLQSNSSKCIVRIFIKSEFNKSTGFVHMIKLRDGVISAKVLQNKDKNKIGQIKN